MFYLFIYLFILHVEKNSTCKTNAKYFAFLSFSIEERKSNEIKSLGGSLSPPFRVDRLKRDIKFIQSHDGGTMVCYHKIALYNVEYLPEQNKIWLYKFQRRFLRDRPAHLGENQAEKRKGDTVKIPRCHDTRVTMPCYFLFCSS